jgi:ketosteroid isomerase-like protein
MSGVENAKKLERLYDVFEDEGVAAAAALIEELFDPDVEFNTVQTGHAGGRTYRGFEGMAGFFSELHAEFEDVHYETPQFHPVGKRLVVAFTRLVGKERGSSMPVRQDLALVYAFNEDGRVARVEAYDTPAEALEAAQRGHADA